MRIVHPGCGVFTCTGCDQLLTESLAEALLGKRCADDLAPPALNQIGSQPPSVRRYLADVAERKEFLSGLERGPRGGAMIDFGSLIVLECYLPFVREQSGDNLPLVPMELTGELVHDLAKSSREACEAGLCDCDDRPEGWILTRPILRAMLGVTDSYLNEHSVELPGRLHRWELTVSTLPFMRDFYFNPDFAFSTRKERRNARKAYHGKRGLARRKERRISESTPLRPLRRPPLSGGGKSRRTPKRDG